MEPHFREATLSRSLRKKWTKKFKEERVTIENECYNKTPRP